MARTTAGERQAPTRTAGSILAGLAIIAIALGGFGAWGAVTDIASAVVAPGQLKVHTNRKKVQHVDGGRVEQLLVRDGDRVSAGDLLMRLDPIRAKASYEILVASRSSVAAAAARLRTERDRKKAIVFPDFLRDAASDPKVAEILQGQEALFAARRDALAGEVEILGQQIEQLGEEIGGMRAQVRSKDLQIKLIKEELDGLRQLYSRGHASKTRILALERDYARLEGERGELLASIARSGKSISEAKMRILQLERTSREQVVTQLRDIETQLADIEERLVAARSQLDQIEIRAPVSGLVVSLAAHTVGGVIGAGQVIMEIVPEEDRLIIEARADPLAVDSLTVGLPADIRLTGLKQRTTPTLTGSVGYVSADSLTDERTGQTYYLVHVLLAEEELTRLQGQALQPGMPAEVIIRTGERTPLQYLTQPIMDSLRRSWRED